MATNPFLKRYEQLGWAADPAIRTTGAFRVNTLIANDDEVAKRLVAKNIKLERVPFVKHGFFIRKASFSLGATPEYLRGLFYLQDAAAQVPAEVLRPQPSDLVLDCCASPGGKTTQMAAMMDNRGVIISFEKNNNRIASLRANLERCGVNNVIVYNDDASEATKLGMQFDKVLLDAPCAGNFASDKEWFQKRTLEDVKRNNEVQRLLLQAATKALKPGGVMVYSTCSLEPEEDEMMMDWAIKNLPLVCIDTGLSSSVGSPGLTQPFGKQLDRQIALTRRFWPDGNHEGFFVAKLVKKEAAAKEASKGKEERGA
jgi:NOL1/NOP2/sun family putative RNA methylase